MKRLILAIALLVAGPAAAQWQVPNNTIPVGRGQGITGFTSIPNTGTGTLCLLNTAPPTFSVCPGGGSTTPGGISGQIQFNNTGLFDGFTASGDATINTTTGAVAVTKTGGVAFGPLATQTPPVTTTQGGTGANNSTNSTGEIGRAHV